MASSYRQSVTIRYSGDPAQQLGTKIYVAGAFSNPPWQPTEMEKLKVSSSEGNVRAVFSQSFDVQEGLWQYKFRIGEGDWWVCDPSADIVTDEHGNQNNMLIVTRKTNHHGEEPTEPRDEAPDTQQSQSFNHDKKGHNGLVTASKVDNADPEHNRSAWQRQSNGLEDGEDMTQADTRNQGPEIGKISYIMQMPKNKDGSKEIMASQDGEIYRLSPDFTRHVPMSTNEEDNHDSSTGQSSEHSSKLSVSLKGRDSQGPFIPSRRSSRRSSESSLISSLSTGDEVHNDLPLLPHERLSNASAPTTPTLDSIFHHRESIIPRAATFKDMHDPNIEVFPEGKIMILNRMKTLRTEIPEDDSSALDDENPPVMDIDTTSQRSMSPLTPLRTIQELTSQSDNPALDGADSSMREVDEHPMREIRAQSASSYKTAVSRSTSVSTPGEPESTDGSRKRSVSKQSSGPDIPVRKSSSLASMRSIKSANRTIDASYASYPRQERQVSSDSEARGLLSATGSGFVGQVAARERWWVRLFQWLQMIFKKLVASKQSQKRRQSVQEEHEE